MGDAGGAGGNNMNIKQAKNEVKNTVKAYLSLIHISEPTRP